LNKKVRCEITLNLINKKIIVQIIDNQITRKNTWLVSNIYGEIFCGLPVTNYFCHAILGNKPVT
jgi:hypothetical protein